MSSRAQREKLSMARSSMPLPTFTRFGSMVLGVDAISCVSETFPVFSTRFPTTLALTATRTRGILGHEKVVQQTQRGFAALEAVRGARDLGQGSGKCVRMRHLCTWLRTRSSQRMRKLSRAQVEFLVTQLSHQSHFEIIAPNRSNFQLFSRAYARRIA